jgi:sterol desaturase/sphingolipid hydroxylase (fatty acid hydroxylase superfamily)
VPVTPAIALAASVVLLDFFAYWNHRLMHALPPLWRLHALHHSDSDLDVTTTIRHHPVEVLAQSALDAWLCPAIRLFARSRGLLWRRGSGRTDVPSRQCGSSAAPELA